MCFMQQHSGFFLIKHWSFRELGSKTNLHSTDARPHVQPSLLCSVIQTKCSSCREKAPASRSCRVRTAHTAALHCVTMFSLYWSVSSSFVYFYFLAIDYFKHKNEGWSRYFQDLDWKPTGLIWFLMFFWTGYIPVMSPCTHVFYLGLISSMVVL